MDNYSLEDDDLDALFCCINQKPATAQQTTSVSPFSDMSLSQVSLRPNSNDEPTLLLSSTGTSCLAMDNCNQADPRNDVRGMTHAFNNLNVESVHSNEDDELDALFACINKKPTTAQQTTSVPPLSDMSLSQLSLRTNSNDEPTLKGYTSDAQNAAVIVYGTSKQDNQTCILFCYENNKGFWTVPGGKKEKSHPTIIDTAVNELYEETGAYPFFHPTTVKPFLEQQSAKSVFQSVTKQGLQTDLFAFNLDSMTTPSIDDLSNIGAGFMARTQHLSGSFREVTQWKLLPLTKVREEFVTNARSKQSEKRQISNMTYYLYNVDGLGYVPSSSYNSLKNFFLQGKLDEVIRKSKCVNHQLPQVFVNDFRMDVSLPEVKETKPIVHNQTQGPQNVKLQVMVLKQYPEGDYAILLQKNPNNICSLLCKDVIDDGQTPLFRKATQFLAEDHGIDVGEKIESVPFENFHFFVVCDDNASAAKLGYAWPFEDFLSDFHSGISIPSTLQCLSRGDGNGNNRKTITLDSSWMGQLQSNLGAISFNYYLLQTKTF
jgi:ADP-ribose pyrophosphatase YjhB (NUDIX family)